MQFDDGACRRPSTLADAVLGMVSREFRNESRHYFRVVRARTDAYVEANRRAAHLPIQVQRIPRNASANSFNLRRLVALHESLVAQSSDLDTDDTAIRAKHHPIRLFRF